MDKVIAQKINEKVDFANVKNYTHCATRLRFTLHDSDKVSIDEFKQIEGVVGVVNQGGQVRIIIGNNVKEVYKFYKEVGEAEPTGDDSTQEYKKSLVNRILDIIAGIFIPIVPALVGAGMKILADCH